MCAGFSVALLALFGACTAATTSVLLLEPTGASGIDMPQGENLETSLRNPISDDADTTSQSGATASAEILKADFGLPNAQKTVVEARKRTVDGLTAVIAQSTSLVKAATNNLNTAMLRHSKELGELRQKLYGADAPANNLAATGIDGTPNPSLSNEIL